jgi:hypothetical protein
MMKRGLEFDLFALACGDESTDVRGVADLIKSPQDVLGIRGPIVRCSGQQGGDKIAER